MAKSRGSPRGAEKSPGGVFERNPSRRFEGKEVNAEEKKRNADANQAPRLGAIPETDAPQRPTGITNFRNERRGSEQTANRKYLRHTSRPPQPANRYPIRPPFADRSRPLSELKCLRGARAVLDLWPPWSLKSLRPKF